MIGYRRSSNKLIVSTSWLSMCYSSKSSAGTWLLHFNSSLAKLTIYYFMCWLRSEKMNWLLIRVALRGHRGETTHSPAISVDGGPFLPRTAGAGPGHRVWSRRSVEPVGNRQHQTRPPSRGVKAGTRRSWMAGWQGARGRLFGSASFLNKSLTSEGLWIGKLWKKYLTAGMICGEYYCLAHFSCAASELALLSQLIRPAYRRCSILSSSTQDK